MLRTVFVMNCALLATLASCSPSANENWRRVGGLDGDVIPFVQIDPSAAKDGEVYRDAIERLCGPGRCIQVGFFMTGDRVPASGSRGDFFRAGGWSGYEPLAVYMGGKFTEWDCERAGSNAAPVSALCGEGIGEEFNAILRIATRDGWVTGCGLPPVYGRALVDKFVSSVDTSRREQLLSHYEQMLASSSDGPDDPADCQRLRPKIDGNAAEARVVLEENMARSMTP